jgi:hypothetical protein
MFRLTKKKKALVGLAIAGAVVAGSGAAYAYWSTTGSGTGSAAAQASTQAVTAVQTSTISTMAPGVAAQTLTGNFNNPNAGKVYINQVVASIASVTKAAGAPAGTCDATDFTLSNATMSVGAEIGNGNGVGSWTGATIAFNDKATNQDPCKGATVNMSYAVS